MAEKCTVGDNPDWDNIKSTVLHKIDLLQAAWSATAAHDRDMHEQIARDLYIPAVRLLGEFCACIEETEESGSCHDGQ